MSKFIERFKGRHVTDGKPQGYEFAHNPHNSPLDHDTNAKQVDNTPASKQTAKRGAKQVYKKENTTTAKRGERIPAKKAY